MHLLKNVRISRVYNTVGAVKKSTALYGRAVDMAGFEGCLFIALGTSKQMGASTDKAYMRVQAANTTAGTFYTLSGTTASSTMGKGGSANWSSNSMSEKVLAVDVFRPLSTHRHLRPVLIGTSTGDWGGIIAIQYGAKVKGSSDMWLGSTSGTVGSSRWQSTKLGGQTVAVTPSVTTATTK